MPSPEEQQAIREICAPLRSPCVVELGAHTGEDEGWIRGSFQEPVHYLMVEPDPRNVQAILDRAGKLELSGYNTTPGEGRGAPLGNHSIYQYNPALGSRRLIVGAVADEVGMKEFHFSYDVKTSVRASGSLREPTGHLVHFQDITFPCKGIVQTYTLDWIFDHEWLSKIDLLWADIQGAEDMMIRGGQTALKHTRYLFMEVEQKELYAGEQLRDGLVGMLPGWSIVKEFPYNILMHNPAFEERGPR